MSHQNVELVRRWAERLAGGELPLLSCPTPSSGSTTSSSSRSPGPTTGHEGLRRWWQDVAEAFEEIRFEVEELIDLDGENQALKAAGLRE